MFGIYSEHSTQTRTSPHNCRPPAVNVTHFTELLQPRIALLQPRCPSASTATARMQRVLHAQCICCSSSPVIPRLPMSSPLQLQPSLGNGCIHRHEVAAVTAAVARAAATVAAHRAHLGCACSSLGHDCTIAAHSLHAASLPRRTSGNGYGLQIPSRQD